MGIGWWVVGLCLATLCGACLRPDSRRPGPGIGPGSIASATDFSLVALPVYRLVASPGLLDSPSRLLAVQVRIEGSGSASYSFAPDDLSIALPDGSQARIFDSARAALLLQRALLADADMSYLLRPDHLPGGLGTFSAGALSSMVQQNLLAPGTFGPGQALQGYVIIDTGQPMMTLDGASFAVVARRIGDDAPARYAYQLATAPQAETGTP
jgi:hypothetical protein